MVVARRLGQGGKDRAQLSAVPLPEALMSAQKLPRIGRPLRVLRVERGLRLLDVSAISDLSQSRLSLIERDEHTPSSEELRRICAALRTSPAELMRRTNGARG
jgi:DNA-binding Xre family transcriptional regulator